MVIGAILGAVGAASATALNITNLFGGGSGGGVKPLTGDKLVYAQAAAGGAQEQAAGWQLVQQGSTQLQAGGIYRAYRCGDVGEAYGAALAATGASSIGPTLMPGKSLSVPTGAAAQLTADARAVARRMGTDDVVLAEVVDAVGMTSPAASLSANPDVWGATLGNLAGKEVGYRWGESTPPTVPVAGSIGEPSQAFALPGIPLVPETLRAVQSYWVPLTVGGVAVVLLIIIAKW